MTAKLKVPLLRIHDCLPIGLKAIYNLRCKNAQALSWLSNTGPTGAHSPLLLWVDPQGMLDWSTNRGRPITERHKLDTLASMVHKYGVEVNVATVMEGQS